MNQHQIGLIRKSLVLAVNDMSLSAARAEVLAAIRMIDMWGGFDLRGSGDAGASSVPTTEVGQ